MIIVFTLMLAPMVTKSFAEEFFNGYSSIDPPLSEVVSGQSSVMTIRFLYTSGAYAMNNFTPIIEVNPSSAQKFVKIDVDSLEITQGQIKRIPVTLTIDPHIEHDKIFLSISYVGNHFMSGELQKSSWNDQVTLDVIVKDSPVPEPEQDRAIPENCGTGTVLEYGICVQDTDADSSNWTTGYPKTIQPPLKQIQNGIALFDVKCSDDKVPAYKHDNMSVACVTEETHSELITRGWALLRFTLPDENPSHVLCNRYDGKWHSEHNGCRGDISDLQCSLMGGKFVDNLKICYNDICPENKTYTLCVAESTKHKLIERGWAGNNSSSHVTNPDISITNQPKSELVSVKITGTTAFQICSMMGIPCTTNPTYDAIYDSKTEIATFDTTVGIHVYNFTLNTSKICYTVDGLNDRYCEPLDNPLIPEGAGNNPTLLSKDVSEWKNMSDKQLEQYYEYYGDNFYTELGRMLIKDRILGELDKQNIKVDNHGESISVNVGMINESLPPQVYYNAVVNSTNGESYKFNGMTHSNKIIEFSSEFK